MRRLNRARLPALGSPVALADWLASPATAGLDAGADGLRLPLLYLDPEAPHTLSDLPVPIQHGACFVIGPEGGMGESEVQRMLGSGARAVTLGPRIFRTETAGLAAIIAAMALSGNLE